MFWAMKTAEFCENLARECPALSDLLAEHKADYDDISPRVFLGDVTRYVLAGGTKRRDIVTYLNKSVSSGDPDVENLVAVSFVENLESREELESAVAGVNASQIVAEWERQQQHRMG